MRFEWDEEKRGLNIERHGIDFVDVEKILAGETITFLDDRFDYGETRLSHLRPALRGSGGDRPYRERRDDPSNIG